MLILGIIILFIIGFLTIHLISIRFSTSEKAGLAFPVGLGLETMMMALIDLSGIPLTTTSILTRSEEHTSELQSPDHLVCRLLLEKKKFF